MRRNILLGLLLTLVSCTSPSASPQPEISSKVFTAYPASYRSDSPNGSPEFGWNEDDKVSVFGDQVFDRHQKFKVTQVDGNKAQLEGRILPADRYYAISPYRSSNGYSEKGLRVNIPTKQVPIPDVLSEHLSYAESTGDVFHFHPAGALLRFSLPASSSFVSARLSGLSEEVLSGNFLLDLQDEQLHIENQNQVATEVILQGRMESGPAYHILIAPTIFEKGLALDFESEEGIVSTSVLEGRREVSGGDLLDCGELKLIQEGEEYPGTTELGRKLAQADSIIGQLDYDQSWTLTPGLVATEIAYVNCDGLETHAFFLEVDLNEPGITLSQTTPNCQTIGNALQAVTVQALKAEECLPNLKIWAGTNSDFFDLRNGTNLPHGIFQHEGVEYKNFFNPNIRRKMSFFYLTKDKVAGIGLAKDYNYVASTGKILEACGGGELLVDQGKAQAHPQTLEPRTCIGISEDGKKVTIMVVDGRQPGYSNGMSLEDLAICMQAIGTYTAINLDGGGSSTFFVRNPDKQREDASRFEVRNQPSDGRERGVATGLVVVSSGTELATI